MKHNVDACFWFRRDLRLEDNVGLKEALTHHGAVLGVFIFDQAILSQLEDQDDARVTFIFKEVKKMKQTLRERGSDLLVVYSDVETAWQNIFEEYKPQAVYANTDFEPYARMRDEKIAELASTYKSSFVTFLDHLIFAPGEISKDDGTPYTVYTPFSKKWLKAFTAKTVTVLPATDYAHFAQAEYGEMPSLEEMGFVENTTIDIPGIDYTLDMIERYVETRDIPSLVGGTSRLGLHLRFGTISIRPLYTKARQASENTFLKELIWREFFAHLLWYYPHSYTKAFKPAYDHIPWRTGPDADRDFEAWKKGETGYPIVDAGMRELATTGYMHNRVRMITASFLCKHLLIDWHRGERYFAQKLLDYELASNVGNWQWASSSGADAAPYFRIFNPEAQQKKFDPDFEYIKKWVREYGTDVYPSEIVDYKIGRERALETYKKALSA